jgi:hypothetical protein
MRSAFLAWAIVLFLCPAVYSQSPLETDLYAKLSFKGESGPALERVLKASDEYSAAILYLAAFRAQEKNQLEDAIFLLYAAQLRAQFDTKCFRPKGEGPESPWVLYSALQQDVGAEINPKILSNTKIFAKAIERITAWNPKASKDYQPDYPFSARKTEQEAHAVAMPERIKSIDGLKRTYALLQNPEFFAALQIVQAYNLGAFANRP